MSPDEQTIRDLDAQWYAAEQRKDLDGFMRFVAADAVYLTPNRPPINGRDGIRRAVAEAYHTLVSIEGRLSLVDVAASGDLAYAVGRERTVWQRGDDVATTEGSCVVIWKKTAGEWRAVAMSITNDAPLH
jgi:uncharacterized protein (TIGR02246 family)